MTEPETKNDSQIIIAKEAKDNLLVCYLLLLATVFGGVSAIVGIIILYANRDENQEDWTDSHFTYLINTFWIGLGMTLLAATIIVYGVFQSVFLVVLGGFLGFSSAILYYSRIVIGGLRLYHNKEIINPDSWLI